MNTVPPTEPTAQESIEDVPYAERLRAYSNLFDQVALRLQRRLRKATSREQRMQARLELGAFIVSARQQLLPESAQP